MLGRTLREALSRLLRRPRQSLCTTAQPVRRLLPSRPCRCRAGHRTRPRPSAARLLYDRAASAGSAHAATAMGKTYDATVLAGIGVVGPSPDPALAAQWYRRGLSLGDEEARTRLQSLPPAAGYVAPRAERP